MCRFCSCLSGLLIVLAGAAWLAPPVSGQIPSTNPHWIWQNPHPHGDTMGGASFPNPQEGWAVGMTQGVMHTSDGGATWNAQRFGPPFGFLDVSFQDLQNGCVVGESSGDDSFGDDSIIWRTTDGGANWKQVYDGHRGGGLGTVAFTTRHIGWAAGRFGALLKTTDGGRHWKKVSLPPEAANYDLTDVSFADKKHGWAIGGHVKGPGLPNLFLRTRNGGATWDATPFQATEDAYLWKIAFPTDTEGWAVGDFGCIYHTSDGGTTWTEQVNPHTDAFIDASQVLFTDARTGYVVMDDGFIVSTTDGGVTWIVTAQEASGLYAITFSDASRGWAFGADGIILRTSDAGKSWDRLSQGTTEVLLSCSFVSASMGWAVGTSGLALGTTDGGQSWTELPTGTANNLRSVRYLDAREGWAVGDAGTILHTDDGGLTWTPQSSGTVLPLAGLDFVDHQHGWAVGQNATILLTVDGGATWSSATTGATFDLYAVDFVDTLHGWAVGVSQNQLLRTADGGNTWETLEIILEQSQMKSGFFSVNFTSPLEGWVCGGVQIELDVTTAIGHTTDGGETWERQTLSAEDIQELRAMVMTADGHGWAAGEHGIYYTTTNSGVLWTKQTRPCPDEWIVGMAFPSLDTGYMVGSGGTILKTTDGGGAR